MRDLALQLSCIVGTGNVRDTKLSIIAEELSAEVYLT